MSEKCHVGTDPAPVLLPTAAVMQEREEARATRALCHGRCLIPPVETRRQPEQIAKP